MLKTKFYIKTFGCQANIVDSEQMAGLLKDYELVDDVHEADFVIVNSCSVKNSTQSSVLDFIEKNLDKKLFVGGCLTKTFDLREKFPSLNGVFDTNSITKIKEIIEEEKDLFSDVKESRINVPVIRKDNDVGVIAIGEGCLNNCTFCSTKLARGNLKSYRIGDVKRAVEEAVDSGCKRINLTSQDNGCYGFDIKTDLVELLEELVEIEGDFQIRVGMMNPWHLRKIKDKLLKVFENDKIMKFLHIPVQSGSEKVLNDMKRVHTVVEFKEIVDEFRAKFKGISISTDVILGYPGEEESDFLETYNLIEKYKPEVLNISMFSSRANTKAANLKQLDSLIIKNRSRKITELYKGYRNA